MAAFKILIFGGKYFEAENISALALGANCDTLGGHGGHHGGSHRQARQEEEAALDSYAQPSYGEEDLDTAASDAADPLAMLQASIPGVPGEDYPIYAEVKIFQCFFENISVFFENISVFLKIF